MGTNLGPYENKAFWYHENIVTNPHTRKNKIGRLHKRIDELCQFQGKEFFYKIQNT